MNQIRIIPSLGKRLKIFLTVFFLVFAIFAFSGLPVVRAAAFYLINWFDLSPAINPNPDFLENDANAVEDDTFFSGLANPHLDPYHGLGSSTGGLSGFDSQVFPNVSNSGLDLTVYYSRNNWDGDVLEGPDLYKPITNENPDRRVTGEYVLRVTRDHIGTRTPTTVVLSFSEPVFLDEFLIGSLSIVGASHEHAIVRAFGSEDATGPVVKANDLINISNLDDCTTLLFTLCDLTGPITSNSLDNIVVDPDLTDGGDGDYDNVGTVADDGLYHVYGDINQLANGYGRFKVVYQTTAIRSVVVSFFPTAVGNPNPFTDTAYTAQWISTIVAPHTFTPEAPTAISLNKKTVTVQNTGLLLLGLALITLAVFSVVVVRRQSVVKQNAE